MGYEIIEFHRRFDKFAAGLVRCLSLEEYSFQPSFKASFARKSGESATCQNAVHEIRFSYPTLFFCFYLYSIPIYIFKSYLSQSLTPSENHNRSRLHHIFMINANLFFLFITVFSLIISISINT